MLIAIFALVAGLLIGSFLNVCIYRMPRDLSVVRPRSFCPVCEHMIAWYDNVPLASFIMLRGKCRHCGARISARYPVVEGLTALCFFAAVVVYGPTPLAAKYCLFTALMVGLAFSDLEELILPNELTVGGVIAGLALAAWVPPDRGLISLFFSRTWPKPLPSIGDAALAALVSSLLLWSVGWLYLKVRHREGLGFGDVKMMAAIAAFLGLQGALAVLILGSLLGSLIGLVYIYAARKDASTYELPFGTFLAAAAILAALFGDKLMSLWLRLLG